VQLMLLHTAVQTVAGILGGAAAGTAVKQHGLGILLNVLAGAVGGGFGGFLLQAAIPAMVNGSGEPNLGGSPADDLAMRALAGFIAGGLLALIFNILSYIRNSNINNK
jgi:uncharacterized membrane protein YeaQ/YmgE (transglycosylase-associated protein family)